VVVVDAHATGSVCIWRSNHLRAKLGYRTFHIYALLGETGVTLVNLPVPLMKPDVSKIGGGKDISRRNRDDQNRSFH
jgi:hypothetical protein